MEKFANKIFLRYSKDAKTIGIGMGRTMKSLSMFFPQEFTYCPASNQTSLFLSGKSICDPQACDSLDLYLDSADYYDNDGNLIKGGGGSLTAEKLLLTMSKKAIILVQAHKNVQSFNGLSVPIEIIKKSLGFFMKTLKEEKIKGKLRLVNSISPFITDGGNYIVDVKFNYDFLIKCKSIVGVIEHGYFPSTLGFVIEAIS
ncbi:hypothetical protein GINT2_001492 [Glugoides intestinalis]